jgi:hypothetical protein
MRHLSADGTLHAWLANFHVEPRADLEAVLRGAAKGKPARFERL